MQGLRQLAVTSLLPGDLVLCGDDRLARTVIDADLAGRARAWSELPLTNVMCNRRGEARLQRWPYAADALVTAWRP